MQLPSMRVAVVAHALRAGGGISVGSNIIRSLVKVRPKNTYLIFTPEDDAYSDLQVSERTTIETFRQRSYLQRAYYDKVQLPRILRSFAPDVIFSLGNIPVHGLKAFQALLIQNSYLVYPEVAIPGLRAQDKFSIFAQASGITRSLAFINMVFCQTEVMRHRFRETFSFEKDILILPNAVSEDVIRNSHPEIVNRLPVPEKSFKLFTLSRYYPSKNLEAIVECFDRYRDDLHDVMAILTISEHHHPNAQRLLATIHRRQLDAQIINIGPVPQRLLPDYYRQIDALLLPTLLESFSGTYLESMAFDRPILTSDRDFARETCGEAALFFEPLSPQSMRDAIVQMKMDHALRARLVASGRRRIAEMSSTWDEIVSRAMAEIEGRLS